MQRCAHSPIRKIDWRTLVQHRCDPLQVVGGSELQQPPTVLTVHHNVHAPSVLHECFLVRHCLRFLPEERLVNSSSLVELPLQRILLVDRRDTKKLPAGHTTEPPPPWLGLLDTRLLARPLCGAVTQLLARLP